MWLSLVQGSRFVPGPPVINRIIATWNSGEWQEILFFCFRSATEQILFQRCCGEGKSQVEVSTSVSQSPQFTSASALSACLHCAQLLFQWSYNRMEVEKRNVSYWLHPKLRLWEQACYCPSASFFQLCRSFSSFGSSVSSVAWDKSRKLLIPYFSSLDSPILSVVWFVFFFKNTLSYLSTCVLSRLDHV